MEAWESSSSSAIALMDSRAQEVMKKIVRYWDIHSFDGNIAYWGEQSFTVMKTGEQVHVETYRVVPVCYISGGYLPITFEVYVAKDTGKVWGVMGKRE